MFNKEIHPSLSASIAARKDTATSSLTSFSDYAERLADIVRCVKTSERDGCELETDTAFDRLCRLTDAVIACRGTIFFCGNGASATMASHAAADRHCAFLDALNPKSVTGRPACRRICSVHATRARSASAGRCASTAAMTARPELLGSRAGLSTRP